MGEALLTIFTKMGHALALGAWLCLVKDLAHGQSRCHGNGNGNDMTVAFLGIARSTGYGHKLRLGVLIKVVIVVEALVNANSRFNCSGLWNFRSGYC